MILLEILNYTTLNAPKINQPIAVALHKKPKRLTMQYKRRCRLLLSYIVEAPDLLQIIATNWFCCYKLTILHWICVRDNKNYDMLVNYVMMYLLHK